MASALDVIGDLYLDRRVQGEIWEKKQTFGRKLK
jgi:hypothetical protein